MKLDVTALRRLSPLLDTALDLDNSEREVWITGLKADQADLVPILRELLAKQARVETSNFLQKGPAFTTSGSVAESANFKPGDCVGPHRLLREIGRGGMGEIWLAERIDASLKRQVALKLPSLGLRRGVLVQRFERERDILASLSHPHIARLYDAGVTVDQQPYLALEYIQGRPITDYCSEVRLELRQKVQLLLQVTEAVQYAHANLVIHRDIKPSNVLVTAMGQAMLLDFGIAKLLQAEDSQADETELTRIGGRALTLSYAAPEQVSGAPISIATDIYALGVLLHELLTGQRPFSGTSRELEDAILTRDPARLTRVPEDLSTIVLKALKKSPGERYATVNAFAEDLRRWLKGEPVLAQADSAWYRARRFTGRHRAAVGTTVLLMIVVFVASGVSLRQARIAREQATIAMSETATAKAVQAFLLDIFKANSAYQANPLKARQTTARELLDLGAGRVDSALKDAPLSRFEVQGTLADMYVQLGLEERASELQQRRVSLAHTLFEPNDERLAEALLSLVETLHEGADRPQVPALLQESFAVLDAAAQERSPTRASAMVQAMRYWNYESLAEARRSTDAAVAYLQQDEADRGRLATALFFEGVVRDSAFDSAAAQSWYEKSIGAAQQLGPAAPSLPVGPTRALGEALMSQLRFAAAETHLRAALALTLQANGEDHRNAIIVRTSLSNLLLTVGRTAEGLALRQQVLGALESNGTGSDKVGSDQLGRRLSSTLLERGRPDLTLAPLRTGIANMRIAVPNSSGLVRAELALAEALAVLGQPDEAQQLVDSATQRWRRFAGDAPAPFAASAFAVRRAAIALARHRPQEALVLLESATPVTAPDSIRRHTLRAQAGLMLGRPAEALGAADRALQAVLALPEGWRPVAMEAAAMEWRGLAQRDLGDLKAASSSLRRALTLRRAHDADGSLWRTRVEQALAALPSRK